MQVVEKLVFVALVSFGFQLFLVVAIGFGGRRSLGLPSILREASNHLPYLDILGGVAVGARWYGPLRMRPQVEFFSFHNSQDRVVSPRDTWLPPP